MKVVDTASMMNPQCKYGEDVMSRITYSVMHEDGLERMSNDIVEGLNSLIEQACKSTHPSKKKAASKEPDSPVAFSSYLCLTPDDIMDMTIVGNTAMHHILLKLNPEHVGLAPFPPVVHRVFHRVENPQSVLRKDDVRNPSHRAATDAFSPGKLRELSNANREFRHFG